MAKKNSETIATHDRNNKLTGSLATGGKTNIPTPANDGVTLIELSSSEIATSSDLHTLVREKFETAMNVKQTEEDPRSTADKMRLAEAIKSSQKFSKSLKGFIETNDTSRDRGALNRTLKVSEDETKELRKELREYDSKYGPQTIEVTAILRKLADRRQYPPVIGADGRVFSPHRRQNLDAANAAGNAFLTFYPDATAASRGALEVIRKVKGLKAKADEAYKEAFSDGYQWLETCRTMQWGIFAIACKHVVGGAFTQEYYDTLTAPINYFLSIVDNTEPDSPERVKVLKLLSEGTSLTEALDAVKRA